MVQLGNATGAVTKTYDYDAFGNEKNIDASDTNPMRYCGEYFDKETGTLYLRARYYDASVGRFISEDSYRGNANDPLSLNLYTYCTNNPVLYWDPSGYYKIKQVITDDDVKIYAIIEEGDTLYGIASAGVNDGTAYNNMIYEGDASKLTVGSAVEITGIYNASYPVSNIYVAEIDLGAGWKARKERDLSGGRSDRHVHVYDPDNNEWAQNEDGSVHDIGSTQSGDIPKWVKKKLKDKGNWDWDAKSDKYYKKAYNLNIDKKPDYNTYTPIITPVFLPIPVLP